MRAIVIAMTLGFGCRAELERLPGSTVWIQNGGGDPQILERDIVISGVARISGEDGSRIWEAPQPQFAKVTVDPIGDLYIAGSDEMVRLAAATGAVVNRFPIEPTTAAPVERARLVAARGGFVAVGSVGTLLGEDPLSCQVSLYGPDGAEQWSSVLTGGICISVAISFDGDVWVTNGDRSVPAMGTAHLLGRADGTPLVSLPGFNGTLTALDNGDFMHASSVATGPGTPLRFETTRYTRAGVAVWTAEGITLAVRSDGELLINESEEFASPLENSGRVSVISGATGQRVRGFETFGPIGNGALDADGRAFVTIGLAQGFLLARIDP